MTALTFCILSVCHPLTSWSFVPEAAPPHYLHSVVNGTDYGRCAFNVPTSQVLCSFDGSGTSRVVSDTVFRGNFQ